jgi:hypothetical protein
VIGDVLRSLEGAAFLKKASESARTERVGRLTPRSVPQRAAVPDRPQAPAARRASVGIGVQISGDHAEWKSAS